MDIAIKYEKIKKYVILCLGDYMKVIIDPYRGGNDTGREINSQYEKNILLNISKKLSEKLNKLGINTELIRTNDISLTDEERTSIINEIKDKNDIIIQNRISEDGEFDIIYPLRSSDNLPSSLTKDIEKNGIQVDKYYQRRFYQKSEDYPIWWDLFDRIYSWVYWSKLEALAFKKVFWTECMFIDSTLSIKIRLHW